MIRKLAGGSRPAVAHPLGEMLALGHNSYAKFDGSNLGSKTSLLSASKMEIMKDILDYTPAKAVKNSDIIKWWNERRPKYNIILITEFLVIFLLVGFNVTPYNAGYVFGFTTFTLAVANLMYYLGPGTQLIVKGITSSQHTAQSGKLILYWGGILLSVMIAGVCALKILQDIYRKEIIESLS